MKKIFDINDDMIVPNDLIQAMLKAPVDLLWNGGIGTYIKGKNESNNDVGDRANDSLRINSDEVRAKVVGEGGNLGLTQQARVECALSGVRIYTDFIDNSAGVDCSDHEVNIKILLNAVVANGDMTIKQRNKLLASMTDEVADLVLSHNYHQTLAISLAAQQAHKHVDLHGRYIDVLEKSGKLDRALEYLPDEAALIERKLSNKGMARPGIAVLLAYSKIKLKEEILQSDLPEDPFLSHYLLNSFPKPLQKKYAKEMHEHSLRREIIATQVSSRLINEMGFTFVYRLHDETGAPTSAIVRAYTVASAVLNLFDTWTKIEDLDNKISASVQYEMMLAIYRLIRRATRWILKNKRTHYDIQTLIDALAPGIQDLIGLLPSILLGKDLDHYHQTMKYLIDKKVPNELAEIMASKQTLLSALDIIEAASELNTNISNVAEVYFAIDEHLELGWIRTQIIEQPATDHWQVLTRESLRDDLDWQQRLLTTSILRHESKACSLTAHILSWIKKYDSLVERWKYMLTDLQAVSSMNFTMFFVAIRELLDLTQTSIQQSKSNVKKTTSVKKVRSTKKKVTSQAKKAN